MVASSMFLTIATPPLIAVSVVCSCRRQFGLPRLTGSRKSDVINKREIGSSSHSETLTASSPNSATNQQNSYPGQSTSSSKDRCSDVGKKPKSDSGQQLQIGTQNQRTFDGNVCASTSPSKKVNGSKVLKEKKILKEDLLAKVTEQSASSSSSSSRQKHQLIEKMAKKRQDVIVFPRILRWKTTNSIQQIYLRNPTMDRCAIKVKCSDNNFYNVKPTYAFIEPDGVTAFDIIRCGDTAKVDQILLLTAPAKETDTDPRAIFKNYKPSGQFRKRRS